MESDIKTVHKDLLKLMKEVEQIKQMLSSKEDAEEVELTDWAEKELTEARKRKTKISHEDARKIVLGK